MPATFIAIHAEQRNVNMHSIVKICLFALLVPVLELSASTSAPSSQECQKRYEELLKNVPNLNELVFHTDCGTLNMMEIQKVSEVKYGSNIDFLTQVLETANKHDVSGGEAVDLGSGTGVWTKHLLSLGSWKVTAVDSFQQSLDDLSASTSENTREALTLLNQDFRNMTFRQKADLVVANNSLCFVPREDLEGVLSTIYENLKPGGIFAATFWGAGDIRAKDPHLSTFTPEEIHKMLETKYTILRCCDSQEGMAPNLDGSVVPWKVVYAIVQKPL